MKVLIACEFSAIVRDEFIRRGHDAISCDLLPTEKPGPHYQGNILDLLYPLKQPFDLLIAFPPCTYIATSGNRWYAGTRERERGIIFVQNLWNAWIAKICIENPIGVLSTKSTLGKPTQYIHPWQFGHGETKKTCLWLKNLPKLESTNIVNGRKPRIHHMAPSKDRWKNRSRTYTGVAEAMANQWG